jgi:FkbM family methyltransferase
MIEKLSKYGLWWPDCEPNPDDLMVYFVRKITDCDVAASYCLTKGVAVQAGGHVGLWARQLAKSFSFVYTFEPVEDLYAALVRNTATKSEVIPSNCALGAEQADVQFDHRAGGRGKVHADGKNTVQQTTIDALGLIRCDLIYLDIERGEMAALEGAKATIERFSPVICLEVLKGQEEITQAWADKNGYQKTKQIHNDYIFVRR